MADLGDEDRNVDYEAIQDKQKFQKEIESMGLQQDQFEEIEREFKIFLEEIVGNENLETFRQQYQNIHDTLKSTYEQELGLIKNCKQKNAQIFEKAASVRAAIRMASAEVERISSLKTKVSLAYEEVQNQRDKEEKQREKIQVLRQEIAVLKLQMLEKVELSEEETLKQLSEQFEDLCKAREEQEEKYEAVKTKKNDLLERRRTSEQEIVDYIKTIEELGKQIKDTKEKKIDKEGEKQRLNDETVLLRQQIEEQRKILEDKQGGVQKYRDDTRNAQLQLEQQTEMLEIRKREKEALEKETQAGYKQRDKKLKSIKLVEAQVDKEQLSSDQIEKQLKDVRHEYKTKKALLSKVNKEYAPLFLRKGDLDADLGTSKTRLFQINKEYDDLRAEVDENKKRIEAKMRERDLLNKDVVLAEEKEREKGDAIQTLEGELKKLQNKIQGYKAEAQKLQKLIYQLEKDKQKYGIEASQANAKYYQCLEQVKLKNNLITKLQKKNIEAEGRLKQQQNLYEAVRSDRNLYSKNCIEAQEEIVELKMKFRRMTQQISQLKEEIQAKDNTIALETYSKQKYSQENTKLDGDIDKISKQIESCDNMIKTQEIDIARLKYVITEAEQEKQKQRKDYEMVINERDILGTQLIKRNEELQVLYEKIKIQQSTLDKGEIYYQERIQEIFRIQNQISELKRLLIVSQNETACIPDLRREILLLQKELLEQQQKAKFLTDELDKPLNVHRWRKLECTDPETYELIQKIQSLQKRLIAKTEEVSEKDVLIQEKEKLYIELKNILAKQSGPEVAEKLQVYQQNLKERAKQLKDMVAELKNYQAQVNAYRFENERLDKQITDIKQMWFQSRRTGMTGQPLGVIKETNDEDGGMMYGGMNGGMQMDGVM